MAAIPQTPGRVRMIDAGGVPIAVTEFAAAGRPPLVLLHGIGSRGESWWPVIDPLAQHFQIFQVDLRGHGASSKPERGYVVEDYAADLAAVLDALELESPRVMGHSLGALVTLVWASQHPARAAAIACEDPPLRTPANVLEMFDGWQQLASLTPEQAAAWYRQEYPDWSDADCERRAQTITSTAAGVFAEMRAASAQSLATGETDRTHYLQGVQSPALLLRGNPESGGMVAPEDAARFLRVLPHARDVYIPEAGHSLHRDATEVFLAAVIPFLAEQHMGE